MENKKLLKEIYKTINFYKKVDERSKNSGNLVDRTYVHEAINAVGAIETAKQLIEEGKINEEFLYEILPEAKKNLKKLKGLETLTKINGLTKEELKKGYSNPYQLIMNEQEYYSSYLKNKNIKSKIHGKNKEIALNEGAINALITTHYGNAIKWAPENTEIHSKIDYSFSGKTILQFENEFIENQPQRKDIGQNKGIGTEFTNTLIEKLKGSIDYYSKAKLSKTKNPIYGIKIKIPKK
jgi:hypothetical protein